MRHIEKLNPPEELISHTEANRGIDLSWAAFGGEPKRATKRALLVEQGFLCGYSGLEINESTAHLEHLKARCLCDIDKGEQVAYENLIAAYPGRTYNGECPYGAKPKDDYDISEGFVSPLDESCERRFHFDSFGNVEGLDDAARTTVMVLCLNDAELRDLRRSAIEVMVFEDETLDSIDEYIVIMAAMDERDSRGHLQPFSFAIKQVCASFLSEAK